MLTRGSPLAPNLSRLALGNGVDAEDCDMRRTLLALSCVAILVACTEPTGDRRANPRDAVLDAMTALYEAGTLHQEFEQLVSVGRTELRFAAEGDIDNEGGRASMTLDVGILGGSIHMVVADGVVFMRSRMFAVPPGRWVSMDLTELDPAAAPELGGLMNGTTDSSAYLALFAGARDVEPRGREQIERTTTTRYTGLIEVAEVIEGIEQVLGDDVDDPAIRALEASIDQLRALGVETIDFSVWIDDDGLPRRELLTMRYSELAFGDGEARAEVRIDYSAFGEPVDISVPAPSRVTEVDDLARVLTPGGGEVLPLDELS